MNRSISVEPHVHHTQFAYRSDEWGSVLAAHFLHLGQGLNQHPRQFLLSKVAGLEYKFPNVVSYDLRMFDALIPNVLISGQQRPAALAHVRQPFMIGGAAAKMAQMPLVPNVMFLKSF